MARTKYLNQFIPMVEALGETFGKHCEVVLHDLSTPEKSIIAIANGHVTGRQLGGPITDLGLRLFKEKMNNPNDNALVGYRTRTKDGRDLKSTTMFIRNPKGRVVGCLCINIDMSAYLSLGNVIDDFFRTGSDMTSDGENDSPEKFEPSVDSLISQLLTQSIKKVNKPAAYMSKEEKLQIVRDLKEKGFFLIKGAGKRLCKELNVSLPTILYRPVENRGGWRSKSAAPVS
jgi:predicted transcriptional regulator YheO